MSSGARQTTYLIPEVTPGTTPPSGPWDTLRLTGNTLSPTVNTQASDEITSQRISQGSVATSVDIQGDLSAELSYGTFDKLLEAAFYGNWTNNVLTVGSARHTFTVAKNFDDVDVFTLFKGMHVSTFALDIPSDGKITATFNMMGLDYADGDTSTVGTINPPTTTPFMSNINVGTLLVDGQSLEGQACVSALDQPRQHAPDSALPWHLTARPWRAHCDRGGDHWQHDPGLVPARLGDLEEHLLPQAGSGAVPDHRLARQPVRARLPGR
jgi:hypothetical protein